LFTTLRKRGCGVDVPKISFRKNFEDRSARVAGQGMTSKTASAHPSEIIHIKPSKGLVDIDFKAMWQFRDLLLAFAERDIRLRYRQTVLGGIWVILQPLMSALIFAVVFGFIAKMPSQGVPYFLIAFAGMMGWTLFQGNITRVTPSLIGNGPLIRKVYFPRLLAPLGVVPSVLLDFAVSMAVMVVLLLVYRVTPNWGLLLFPLCVLIVLMLSLGMGLIGASLSVKYRDIQHIVPFATQLFMYASPVGYSISAVPERIRPYYMLNPLAEPIDMIRWSILGIGKPDFFYLGYSFLVSAAILWLGLVVFRSCEREFADVI
jgi:lipopolysaccharide transport system permease protein